MMIKQKIILRLKSLSLVLFQEFLSTLSLAH